MGALGISGLGDSPNPENAGKNEQGGGSDGHVAKKMDGLSNGTSKGNARGFIWVWLVQFVDNCLVLWDESVISLNETFSIALRKGERFVSALPFFAVLLGLIFRCNGVFL